MEKSVHQIIELASKRVKKKAPLYVEFPLFPEGKYNSFESFLINDRLKPFLLLQVLFQTSKNKELVIGHENVAFRDKIDDDELVSKSLPSIEVGPSIMNEIQTMKDLFNTILRGFGFSQIINKPLSLYSQPRIGIKEVIDPKTLDPKYDEHLENPVYITADLSTVLTNQSIFVDYNNAFLQEKIKGIIEFHQDEFLNFLEEYKESCVPHDLYIKWLLKWFPGMIQLRILK